MTHVRYGDGLAAEGDQGRFGGTWSLVTTLLLGLALAARRSVITRS